MLQYGFLHTYIYIIIYIYNIKRLASKGLRWQGRVLFLNLQKEKITAKKNWIFDLVQANKYNKILMLLFSFAVEAANKNNSLPSFGSYCKV